MSRPGNILILGLGLSGRAAARFSAGLVQRGDADSVTAVDGSDSDALRQVAEELASLGIRVALGESAISGTYDLCVASPGIRPGSPLMLSAKRACTEVISEIEFAFRHSDHTWVAITGTNGKTTTTALVAHLLNAGGVAARSVGNIGHAAIDAVSATDITEVLVAEVSSFQLALTTTFHPHVAVLLNITPDHVDWHGSLESYEADKVRVLSNLDADDVAVIDVDDEGSAPYAARLGARGVPVVTVCLETPHALGAGLVDGVMAIETRGGLVRLVAPGELLIRGSHNVSNALAAAAAAHSLGVTPTDLRAGLRSFEPIEHRLEPVGTVDGVEWFNDSKATNPDAVFKALTAFGDQPLIVLLGGRNKGNDFAPLAKAVDGRAKAAVVFGESRHELARAFAGLGVHTVEAVTLSDAVEAARQLAVAGDAVVLSPACASFDEFTSYEERGSVFRDLVAATAGREW